MLHLDVVESLSWLLLVEAVTVHVCALYAKEMAARLHQRCLDCYLAAWFVFRYQMLRLSVYQMISQNVNESAALWRYVIGGHTAQRGAMHRVIVFPLRLSIGTVHRGGASCSLHGIRCMWSFNHSLNLLWGVQELQHLRLYSRSPGCYLFPGSFTRIYHTTSGL